MNLDKVLYFLNHIKQKVWFYPVLYSIFAALLVVIIVILDLGILFNIENFTTPLLLTDIDIGETILGIIAGAFITITTFTFSITMVVLTMYTAQYSPRVVKNFLTRKDTLQSFGIFVSGFLYTMLVFVFLSSYPPDTMIISSTIGIIYILVGLIFFFRFINSVASYIQASNLIKRLKEISNYEIKIYKERIEDNQIVEKLPVEEEDQLFKFNSPDDGYIQVLDFKYLAEIATDYNVDIHFHKVIGQFVSKNTKIGTINQSKKPLSDQDKEDIIKKIANGIIIEEERVDQRDFAFTIQKIVEVALKALSPGINDPNTAIQCIQVTSLLLRDLSELPAGYLKMEGKDSEGGSLYIEAIDFEILLIDTYQQIVNYGLADVKVILEILKGLQIIKASASDSSRKSIMEFAEYLWRKILARDFDRLEVEMLRREKRELESI